MFGRRYHSFPSCTATSSLPPFPDPLLDPFPLLPLVQSAQHPTPHALAHPYSSLSDPIHHLFDISFPRSLAHLFPDYLSQRLPNLHLDVVLHLFELLITLVLQTLGEQSHIRIRMHVQFEPVDDGGCPLDDQRLQPVPLRQVRVQVLLHSLNRHLQLSALPVVHTLLTEHVRYEVLQLLQSDELRLFRWVLQDVLHYQSRLVSCRVVVRNRRIHAMHHWRTHYHCLAQLGFAFPRTIKTLTECLLRFPLLTHVLRRLNSINKH